jgi:shikimate kinase
LEGEPGFRAREATTLDELTRRENIVLATGGGAVLKAENRQALRERGTTIYLRANVEDLWQRTRRDKNRPLLQTEDPRARLEELLTARERLYREVAHIIIDTGEQSVQQLTAHHSAWSFVMNDLSQYAPTHPTGDSATHPIARLEGRLALLLLLTGADPAASSRLAGRPSRRPLGRVQLLFLG